MSNEDPELVREFNDTADSLDAKAQELERFQDQLDEYATQVAHMDSTEQSAFYDSATSIANRVEDIDSVDELLSLEADIEEAIRSPLEQVAQESIEEFLSAVNPNLTKEKRDRIFAKLSDKLPNELETIGDTHQELIPKVNNLPPNLQDLVAKRIEDSTSHLLAPHEDIEPFVEDLQTRHSLLTEVEEAFNDAGEWAPAVEFTHETEFYGAGTPTWDADAVRTELDEIQSELDGLPTAEFSLEATVKSELQDACAEMDLAETITILRQVRQELGSIADTYEKLEARCATLEDFGTNQGVFEDRIDDLLAQFNGLPLEQYHSMDELQSSLIELNTELDQFIEAVANRLKAQRKMVDTLQSDSDSDSPSVSIGPGGDSIIMSVHVQDNLQAALEDCAAHNEWISATLETESDEIEQEEMIAIWETLSEGDTVPLSEETADAVVALSEELSLGVVLRGE